MRGGPRSKSRSPNCAFTCDEDLLHNRPIDVRNRRESRPRRGWSHHRAVLGADQAASNVPPPKSKTSQ